MTSLAQTLRSQLADTLGELGPSASTLCEGWTTADLAAHLVARERRPDAAPGMLVPALSGWTDRVMAGITSLGYDAVVERVRTPPVWSPFRFGPVEDAVNLLEFAVHREDARRGDGTGAASEGVSDALDVALWSRLSRMRRILLHGAPTTVRLLTPDGRSSGPDDAVVTVAGPPLELLLFCFGRQGAAEVNLSGPADAVAALGAASLGF